MTIIETHRVRTIHRAIASFEPSTTSEAAIQHAALIECVGVLVDREPTTSSRVMPSMGALLLGPLSLLLCLLLVLVSPTLGGYPEAESPGTGSQGQISDSLGPEGMWTKEWTTGWTKVDE